jgi:rhodanese-related sulfurtransferase
MMRALLIQYFCFFSFIISFGQSLAPANADTLLRHHFADSNFIIIDVCTDGAYASAHLQNAIHHYVYSASFSSDLDAMDKSKLYLLTCSSGAMSASAMGTMATKSFSKVYDISGGVSNWTGTGHKVTTSTVKSVIRFKATPEFSDLLNLTASPVIIDLRNDTSFQRNHLNNAQHIDTAKNKIESVFTDKTKTYFIYGNAVNGHDTTILYKNLYQNGYQQVYVLKDGLQSWIDAKLPYYEYSGPIDTTSSMKVNEISFITIAKEDVLIIIPDFPGEAQYSIFSTDSRLISSGRISGETSIPLAGIAHGPYVLNIRTKGSSVSKILFL